MKILTESPDGHHTDTAKALGYITQLLCTGSRKALPISAIANWLTPPVALGQFVLYFDEQGNPVGYATWAFLADEVSALMERDVINLLHLSEWNEGLNLWVTDLVCLPGFSRPVIRHLRDVTLGDFPLARSLKRDAEESLLRSRTFRARKRSHFDVAPSCSQ
ncbi:hemolysin-activating ACP:hemolysin acyltransferase [Luteibacter jiangsuensis]|uniref:RTX toxin-activating lysine-acyltransferase n=1 Tax=Luteibacter jiangsuensis TaxID=637577 RepID=A0ABT9STF6_9GAMM|nr:toxin-activating lysine-acyltransferase [Luteibacter jiangsuensis]MDQ0008261.1 hemolysin-activating ACP:hemolysin acyltransferase [Luteibacter jiangsuensis]